MNLKKIIGLLFFTSFILIVLMYVHKKMIQKNKKKIIIAIHAGVKNSEISNSKEVQLKLKESLESAYNILKNGESSLKAVEKAITIMEDSGLFNAGLGSIKNNGLVQMDAAIMEGKNLKAGAISCVQNVKNPIILAKLIMEKTPYVMLCGCNTQYLRDEFSIETVNDSEFDNNKKNFDFEELKSGTIGAVALDFNGDLAAGTSTGGIKRNIIGRVADSSVIGAGTYADNQGCAVSCTGIGEFFIRFAIAYDLNALLKYKEIDINDASIKLINKLSKHKADAGIIALDKNGNLSMKYNTKYMLRGYIKDSDNGLAHIFYN